MISATFFSTLNSAPLTFLVPGSPFCKAITAHKAIFFKPCNMPELMKNELSKGWNALEKL